MATSADQKSIKRFLHDGGDAPVEAAYPNATQDTGSTDSAMPRFDALLEDSIHEICTIDSTTLRYDRVSRGARENLGYTLGELQQLTLLDIQADHDEGKFKVLLERLRSGAATQCNFRASHKRKDGSQYPVVTHLHYLPAELHPVIVCISHHITGRTSAEQALVESERRFRAIFNSTYQFMGLLSPDGVVLQANQTALDFIGATGEEVVLMKVWDTPWFRNFPEAQQKIRQSVRTAAQGKLVRDELEISGAGDATATIDFSIKPVLGPDNEISVLLAEGRDISDRIRAEDEKQRYQQEFAHNMRINSMGEIAATMAHELNQPLTALISYCGTADAMLSGLTSAPAGIHDILHRATEQAHRAGQIIQQMRRYIRDETLRNEPVEVDRLILNIERLLEWELKNSDIHLSLGLKCENCVVEVDSIEIEQVMINLVHNGIEAINRTSNAAGSINIQSRPIGNSAVEISIMDSGPGIDASMQDGLFKPCQSDKREGMGLGLTISRSIIEKHGGKLFYDSKTTGQHAFRFTLPLHNQPPVKN